MLRDESEVCSTARKTRLAVAVAEKRTQYTRQISDIWGALKRCEIQYLVWRVLSEHLYYLLHPQQHRRHTSTIQYENIANTNRHVGIFWQKNNEENACAFTFTFYEHHIKHSIEKDDEHSKLFSFTIPFIA